MSTINFVGKRYINEFELLLLLLSIFYQFTNNYYYYYKYYPFFDHSQIIFPHLDYYFILVDVGIYINQAIGLKYLIMKLNYCTLTWIKNFCSLWNAVKDVLICLKTFDSLRFIPYQNSYLVESDHAFSFYLEQPKRDESQPTWLHLRIREFEPRFDTSKTIGKYSIASNHVADGRWTLGFSSVEACEAARLLILEEIQKQRYSVESLLAPLLRSSSRGDLSDSQGE